MFKALPVLKFLNAPLRNHAYTFSQELFPSLVYCHEISMQEFFSMGGYAFYVWTSYGLAFLVLLLNFVLPQQHHRHLLKMLARKQRRAEHDHLNPQA